MCTGHLRVQISSVRRKRSNELLKMDPALLLQFPPPFLEMRYELQTLRSAHTFPKTKKGMRHLPSNAGADEVIPWSGKLPWDGKKANLTFWDPYKQTTEHGEPWTEGLLFT